MSDSLVNCPYCGSALKAGTKFCGKCGKRISPQTQKRCKECGAELMEGVQFCNFCGKKVEELEEIPSVSEQINNEKMNNLNSSQFAVYSTKDGKHQKLGSLQLLSDLVIDEDNRTVFSINNGQLHSIKTGIDYMVDSIGDIYEEHQKVGFIQDYSEYLKNKENNLLSSANSNQSGKSTRTTILILASVATVVITVFLLAVFTAVAARNSSINIDSIEGNNPLINLEYTTIPTTQILIPVIEVTNMEYPDAVKALTDAGFTNISSNVQSPAGDERWVVVSQSVLAGEEIVPDDNIVLECVRRCYLYLDITSDSNLLFNKYSITVSLDGMTLGTVDNGGVITYLADVDCGEHTISFCKSDQSSLNQSKILSVLEDTTYTCKLTHSASSIGIINENIQNNIDKSSLEVIDVTDIPLTDAKNKLKGMGFTNISTDPNGIAVESSWIVTSQSVDPGVCIDKNASIQLGCVKGDDYFSDYIGKNPNECDKMAEGKWYKITYKKDAFTTYDLSLLSERGKEDYIVSSVSYFGGSKDLNLYLIYIGPTPIPTATPTPRPTNVTTIPTAPTVHTSPTSKTVDYSTNDYETAKDGNTGIYSYIRSGPNYDIYLIIDFDEGYVYYFCEGNGEGTCDKMKIDSGDLNSKLNFYYVDGDDIIWYAVAFYWQRSPDHLIYQDDDGYGWDFYSTNLNYALKLRDSKEIYDCF